MNTNIQQFTSLADFYRANPQKRTEREVERELNRRQKKQKEAANKAAIQPKETENKNEEPKMVWVKKTKPQLNVNSQTFEPTGKSVQQMTVQRKDTHVDYASGQVTTTYTTTTMAKIAPKACRYFALGRCKFGDECNYPHENMAQTAPAPQMPMTSKAMNVIAQHTELEKTYLETTKFVIDAVVQENANYRQLVGNTIFPYVQQLVNEQAPTITGMILEFCSIQDLRAILQDHKHLVIRVAQANAVKRQRDQKVAHAPKKPEMDVQEYFDDNVSESTQSEVTDNAEVAQKENNVKATESAQQSENEHKTAFESWAEAMKKKE